MKSFVALLVSFCVCAVSVHADEKPDPNFFPIMAWNYIPPDPAVMKKLHDCGFTVAGFVYAKDLDAVQAAGMKAIVSDPRCGGYDWANVDEAKARENIQSLVKEVGNHPALYGYYLRDEPPANYFPGLEKVAKQIREFSPGKWAYMNLFPNYAIAEQMQEPSYDAYVEKFIATCHPQQLSYDHYALMQDGSLRDGYWQNLEAMRKAAVKHKLPFWNIVLACGHFDYRVPTWDDLRFQAYSTLCYGGRGIAYFTYFCPPVGSYRGAPIDQFGNPTETWSHLQNINLQIQKLAPVINRLTSDDVYFLGKVPHDCHGSNEKDLVKNVPNGEFCVGDFTHEDGSRYVMIVNTDLKNAHFVAPEYRKAPKRVQMVSPYDGQLTAYEGEQLWLAPGQGRLLKLEY
jgi:hypothetical protein